MSVRTRIAGLGFAGALLQMAFAAQAYDLLIGQNYTSSTLWSDYDTRPPDTTGAVGPGAVVEFTNGSYRCYDKSTGALLAASTLDGFWDAAGVTPAGDGAFGPRVIYDFASNRWFASAADDPSGSGTILIAVSNSSNPLDGWQAFSVDPDPYDTFRFHGPALGVNAVGVFVCANATDADDNVASLVLSVPKSDLTSIVPSVTNCTILFPGDPQTLGYGLQPAVDFGPSVGRGALLAVDYTYFSVLDHTSVLDADTNSASLSGTNYIDVPTASYPPLAGQPGGAWPIDTGDDTIQSSVYKVGGSLWAVHTIDVAGRAGLQWYEIDESTSTLLQSGTISDADHDYYCPSICANDAGVVVIAFNRSADSLAAGPYAPEFAPGDPDGEFASLYAVLGQTSGGTTTFGLPLALVTGTDTYEVSPDGDEINAWGRHSALVRDPDDPFTFWVFGQYASGANEYSTRIVELNTNAADAVPEPGTAGLLVPGLLALIAWRRRVAATPKA